MIFHIFGDKEIENWPREEFDGRKYYIVTPETIKRFEGKDVKFEGYVEGKPLISFYSTGWPWSFERYVEEDHGHRCTFRVSGIQVIFAGVAIVADREKVTIYGRYKDGIINAHIIISEKAIFKIL